VRLKDAFYQTHRDLRNFLEAEGLLKSCLGLERRDLYLDPNRRLSNHELKLLEEAIKERKNYSPLAYIIGEKEFYSLGLRVTPDTFIPRPETEFIVDAVLNIVYGLRFTVYGKRSTVNSEAKSRAGKRLINVVDLGTGCGNVAITLARYIPRSRIYATDISKKALEVAKENAKRHKVEDKITFLEGNLFSPLKNRHLEGKVDFLVSNPPYIVRREIDSLMPEVAKYEPRIALDGGKDGFFFYRRIIEGAPQYLKSPAPEPRRTNLRGRQVRCGAGQGHLVLELGIDQAPQVKEMIKKTLEFESIEIIKDYSQIERVIIARRQ